MPMNLRIVDKKEQDNRYDLFDVHFHTDVIKTTVTSDPDIVTHWIFETESSHSRDRRLIVGLDVEWRPNFHRNQKNPVAVLQICVDHRCLIIQLLYCRSIPESLANFLGNREYDFAGVGIESDVKKLLEDYELNVKNTVGLGEVAADAYGMRNLRNAGLKKLCNVVLGKEITKPKSVTMGRWDSEWLSSKQIQYACLDAFVSSEIARHLNVGIGIGAGAGAAGGGGGAAAGGARGGGRRAGGARGGGGELRGPDREGWRTYSGYLPVGPPTVSWEMFSYDRFIPWSVTEESRLKFESLTQDNLSVAEYETRFCQLSRYATAIIPNEAEKVHRFVRGLNYSLRQAVFRVSRDRASFQSVVSAAKEAELMEKEEFGDPKRARAFGQFSGSSSGGKGFYKEDSSSQPQRPVHALLPTFEAGQIHRGSTRRGGYGGSSGSTHQFQSQKFCYGCGNPNHLIRHCPLSKGQGGPHLRTLGTFL